jgi:hypothetical protein
MARHIRFRRSSQLFIAALLTLSSAAAGQSPARRDVAFEFQSVVPLGVETFKLETAAQTINLVASAESQFFDGVRLLGHGPERVVVAADGSLVRRFPQNITFRVTASARGRALDEKPVPVETTADLNRYLLSLSFRLKIFRGLEYRRVEPSRTELVGVPADVAYDERIYRLLFKVGEVAVEERILLEVYDESGERLTRFHLELM